MEYVDILDVNGMKTGVIKERQEAKRNKDYTLGAHVVIMNSKKEVLLQKRSCKKHNFPGMFDFTGGHVLAYEDSRTAIQRETLEELGIQIPKFEFEYLFRFSAKFNPIPMFLDVFLLNYDIDLEQLTLQSEEVEMVSYVHFSTVIEWYYYNSNFVKQPYFMQLLEMIKERYYGSDEVTSGSSRNQLLYSKTRRNVSNC